MPLEQENLEEPCPKMLSEVPEFQLQEDLRRFKQLMETGEIPTTEGQPEGGKRKRSAA